MKNALAMFVVWTGAAAAQPRAAKPAAAPSEAQIRMAVGRGLRCLADLQAADGRWEADTGAYRVAMTSVAGMAFLMDGSTPAQGRHAEQVKKAADYLIAQARPNGLIGQPERDDRYMYGHGFAMLFLSQTLGEETSIARRRELVAILKRAAKYCADAQTREGGWGYETAAEGNSFDEGSVTVTQMQGLRSCRNVGIPVPKATIDKGVAYIQKCTNGAGGVLYSLTSRGGGARPPLAAAAAACLFSAGEDRHPLQAKLMGEADRHFADAAAEGESSGHWHYAHYYYAQAAYRRGGDSWRRYRDKVAAALLAQQDEQGGWTQGFVGPVYSTALNLAILQLEAAALPIYQR